MVAGGFMLLSHFESICCTAVWTIPAFKCALEIKMELEVVNPNSNRSLVFHQRSASGTTQ